MTGGRRGWQQSTRLKETQRESIQGMENIADLKQGQKIMSEFLSVLIDRWRKNIKKYNIGHEGDLDASFTKRTTGSAGMIKGRAGFLYYGRFVDMGVGKGVKLSEAGGRMTLTTTRHGSRGRRPKPWFSQTWAHERKRLAEIYQKHVSVELLNHTTAALNSSVNINL